MDKHYELVPVMPTENPKRIEPTIIEPGDLENYLFTPEIERSSVLPNSFNLTAYSHYLKELDNSSKINSANQNTPDESTANSVQMVTDLLLKKPHVEKGRTLYLDMETNEVGATDIVSGKETEVELPFLEL